MSNVNFGKVDWNDLLQVMSYARSLGRGMTVFQYPGRKGFNITHTERVDRWKGPGCKAFLHT